MPMAIVNKQSLPADFQYSNNSTMTAERKEMEKQTMKRLSEWKKLLLISKERKQMFFTHVIILTWTAMTHANH